jgi:hypothetical protein
MEVEMRAIVRVVSAVGLAMTFGCASTADHNGNVAESSDQIIGGTTENGHPYVVGVGSNSRAFCTGTVISKRTVLTAGHCYASGIQKIYLGTNIMQGAPTIAVARAVRHPGFRASPFPTNDLTVVQLASDAPMQPAPLLRETLANNADFIGPTFTWVGYGDNHSGFFGGGFGTKRIASWAINAVGPAHVGGTPGDIDATMFWYKVPGLSACHGDSGGPAFFAKDGVEHVAGVTSFGSGSCSSDGVQSRSDKPQIDAFIQAQIDTFENNDACRSDGQCNESCNTGGQVRDADCHVNHCAADGICAAACGDDPDCAQ